MSPRRAEPGRSVSRPPRQGCCAWQPADAGGGVVSGAAASPPVLRTGTGHTDLYALDILDLTGPVTPGALGERTGPTTRLVDRPEKAGYTPEQLSVLFDCFTRAAEAYREAAEEL
ncbi:hypothetical protein [Streptomyces sp. NPDC008122]|uniref:hypothetical protein n=1 Tax=Streptomyces sp. NPDC008122 TaxID=3364810 RepID=UPI0036EC74F7